MSTISTLRFRISHSFIKQVADSSVDLAIVITNSCDCPSRRHFENRDIRYCDSRTTVNNGTFRDALLSFRTRRDYFAIQKWISRAKDPLLCSAKCRTRVRACACICVSRVIITKCRYNDLDIDPKSRPICHHYFPTELQEAGHRHTYIIVVWSAALSIGN